jgi:hypothetical protein
MAKSIFRIPCPNLFSKRPGWEKGRKVTNQKRLRALRDFAIPEGAVLNPYGKLGDCQRARYRATWFGRTPKIAYRGKAMKRKRVQLIEKKKVALEAHELQKMARENATMAMETLIEISKNQRAPETNRIMASSVILDRAYGKANQTSITARVTDGKTSDIDSTELDTRIGRALKRVEELTTRAPKAGKSEKQPTDLRKLN